MTERALRSRARPRRRCRCCASCCRRIREARRALIDASERITEAVAADGGGVAGGDWFAAQRTLRTDLTAPRRRGHPAARPRDRARRLPGRARRRAGVPVLAARRGVAWRASTTSAPASRTGSRCERRRAPGRRGARRRRLTTRLPASRPPRTSSSCGTPPTRGAATRHARGGRRGLRVAAPTGPGCRPPGSHASRCGGSSRHRPGSTRCCSPSSIESDVVVTNARGVFDEPIAEWVIGAMLALRDRTAPLDRRPAASASGRLGARPSGSRARGSWSSAPARSGERPPLAGARARHVGRARGPRAPAPRDVRRRARRRSAASRRSPAPTTCSTRCR